MAAVTANQITPMQDGDITRSKAAAERLYAGTMGFYDASTGYVTADDNGGANQFAGIVRQECDNSGGSAGDKEVELYAEGVFRLKGSSFTQATNGDLVYAIDNYTLQTSSTSASKVGRVVNYVNSTTVDVLISLF